MRYRVLFGLVLLLPAVVRAGDLPRAKNVVIVTIDGMRWQEIFTGADDALMQPKISGIRDLAGLKKRYWREFADERRRALMPFLWGTIAKQGQIFGDPAVKARAHVTNGMKFSYPGYSEMFCGFPDKRIDSNDKRLNPNVTVLEFLNQRPAFKDRIGICCTWDVFPFIFNEKRSGLKVHSGWNPIKDEPLTERQRAVNELMVRLPRIWPDNVVDMVTMEASLEHLRRHKPRVMYVGLGETDEWGHDRRYDLYLDAANKSDRFLAELWNELQSMPQYKDQTALIVTTDHGRGSARDNWIDHKKDTVGAEFIWIALMGPDTPAMGVRENVNATQSQIAATIAHLVGEDYNAFCDKAALPLADVRGAKK